MGVDWGTFRLSTAELVARGEDLPTYPYHGRIHSEITNIVAQRETGKSSLLLHLIKSYLTGTPFLRRDCKVVYPEGRIFLVLTEVTAEWGRRAKDYLPRDAWDRLLPFEYPRHIPNGLGLYALGHEAQPKRGDLLLIDSLSGLAREKNEEADIKAVYDPVKEWVAQGASAVITAHASDLDSGARRASGRSEIGFDARRTLSLSKEGKGLGIALHAEGNDEEVVDLTLERGSHVADFQVVAETNKRATRSRHRDQKTQDDRRAVRDFVLNECQGLGRNAAAKKVLEAKLTQLAGSTVQRNLTNGAFGIQQTADKKG